MERPPYMCSICLSDPGSHSFANIGERDGVTMFYSCPAKATRYTDTTGILAHYDGMLEHIDGRSWQWLFDAEGFEMKHALQVGTAVGIAQLIRDKYAASLKEIVIINPTWHVRAILRVVTSFLSAETQKCIRIIE